jgi:hypothetical protein
VVAGLLLYQDGSVGCRQKGWGCVLILELQWAWEEERVRRKLLGVVVGIKGEGSDGSFQS